MTPAMTRGCEEGSECRGKDKEERMEELEEATIPGALNPCLQVELISESTVIHH